jgi:hypothetical protein
MPIISHDTERLSAILCEGEAIFWEYIAEAYPEAKTGDLSPAEAIGLSEAMRSAVTEWLQFNCDTPPTEPRVTEIMLHRIEYNYEEDMELTDSDREHIAYSISQGISEGELSTLVPVTDEKFDRSVRGYWKINNCPE